MFVGSTLCGLLLLLLTEGLPSPRPACLGSCEEGHYCTGYSCVPCESGHFQSEPIYTGTFCKPWTTKPPNSHYVMVKIGTSTLDTVWRCKDGYEERVRVSGMPECVIIGGTVPSAITAETTTSESSPLSEVVTTETSPQGQLGTDKASLGVQIGVPIAVAVVFVIALLVLMLCLRHRYSKIVKIRGSGGKGTVTAPLMPDPRQTYYKFCYDLVGDLGESLAIMFIQSIADPSGKFNAGKIIELEAAKTRDSNIYLAESLVRWAACNNGIDRTIFLAALAFVGRRNLLRDIEVPEDIFIGELAAVNEAANGAAVRYENPSGSGDKTADKRLDAPARYRLFYYLSYKISVHDAGTFLTRLPVDGHRFSAREYFENHSMQNNFSNNFAQTLQELWQRDANTLRNIVCVLKELNRKDILKDTDFKKYCGGTVPLNCPIATPDNL